MRWLTAQVGRWNPRYWLSWLVPVRMRSTYEVLDGGGRWPERTVWWQWRGRVLKIVSCERLEAVS